MKDEKICKDRPTPLPTNKDFVTEFTTTKGDPDPKIQEKLAKSMGVGYRNLCGELIYAMVTCRPDISYATVKLSQSSAAPADIHYRRAKHCMRYLFATRKDGMYFWHIEP